MHNLLHGVDLRRPSLGDRELFEAPPAGPARRRPSLVDRGHVVILQDPQTAGLVPILKRAGATVVWRCHVGADRLSEPVEAAWAFLLPYVEGPTRSSFTRRAFVPPGLDGGRVRLLTPAIDPRSPKNLALSPRLAQAILARSGLVGTRARSETPRVRVDGSLVPVRRRCHVLRDGPGFHLGTHRLVVSLARWDRLKDPVGVMRGFAEHVPHPDARLILAGPAVGAVADDPEGGEVLGETRAAWRRLPASQRPRVQLATLPMVDLDENALIVNALQRQGAVIVKKSLQEGFGLGVTEAMWKARPVVATRVGGHQDQIEHRRTGLLVDDPADLAGFGAAIGELLDDRAEALDLATAAREEARARFLADRHFCAWIEILASCTPEP